MLVMNILHCLHSILANAQAPENTLELSSSHLTPLGCMQTKTVNVPAAPPRTSTSLNAWGSASVPTVGMQSEAIPDGNADATSQASGDASSVTSNTEKRRAGSVTADDETVLEASGAHGNTTHTEAPHTHSGLQVSDSELLAHAIALSRNLQFMLAENNECRSIVPESGVNLLSVCAAKAKHEA